MGEKGATPTANQEEPASVLTLLEAADPEDPARVLTLLEVDPTKEDPAVLNAISSNAADAVWHLVINGDHITGNLNLLTDLTPVCDRWVRSLNGMGGAMQVCARGYVNCNGIRVDDV
ncbi:hypothetical protein BRADI_4g04500v3 [Brachypodium distachyon]|uniref:Uncharacterized protein n=1 Tax=Brachypodium distachyon TaxID=15368 RepID=A0A0Q3GZB6_BRADI|nr:hypothetical protein BRADI_4g04500v3 [Brachypodium distachyon]